MAETCLLLLLLLCVINWIGEYGTWERYSPRVGMHNDAITFYKKRTQQVCLGRVGK